MDYWGGSMMRRILKWAGIAVGVLVVGLVVALGVLYQVSNSHFSRRYAVTVQMPALPTDAASLAEGKRIYLSRGCVDCHGANLAGTVIVDEPLAGSFAGANLTKGQGGVGNALSDADFARVIRHGVKPDGAPTIFMPSTDYFAMTDADLAK